MWRESHWWGRVRRERSCWAGGGSAPAGGGWAWAGAQSESPPGQEPGSRADRQAAWADLLQGLAKNRSPSGPPFANEHQRL